MNVPEPLVGSLPADVDVKRSVLGAILMDLKAYDEAASLSIVAEDFSLDSHQRIYRSIEELVYKGTAIELVLISLLSGRRELAAVGDIGYVSSLIQGLPDRPSIKSYVGILKEKSAQ